MSDERWLEETWPFVREQLPLAPARIVELGCGSLGGFVPRMRALGHAAIGVDPEAPEGPDYDRTEFERYKPSEPVDAIVACASLHHVANLDVVFDRIDSMLKPAGTLVVLEWAHERFDEPTARWCFDRLGATEGWLHHQRDEWRESGQAWDEYRQAWVAAERMHAGGDIIRALGNRFDTRAAGDGPFFFAELDGVTRVDEQAAIDAGLIRATGLHYIGHRRAHSPTTQ